MNSDVYYKAGRKQFSESLDFVQNCCFGPCFLCMKPLPLWMRPPLSRHQQGILLTQRHATEGVDRSEVVG